MNCALLTVQQSTAVRGVVKANFTAHNHDNVILAFSSRLEVYLLAKEGLKHQLTLPINTPIHSLSLLPNHRKISNNTNTSNRTKHSQTQEQQQQNAPPHALVVVGTRLQVCVFVFDVVAQQVVTLASGSLECNTNWAIHTNPSPLPQTTQHNQTAQPNQNPSSQNQTSSNNTTLSTSLSTSTRGKSSSSNNTNNTTNNTANTSGNLSISPNNNNSSNGGSNTATNGTVMNTSVISSCCDFANGVFCVVGQQGLLVVLPLKRLLSATAQPSRDPLTAFTIRLTDTDVISVCFVPSCPHTPSQTTKLSQFCEQCTTCILAYLCCDGRGKLVLKTIEIDLQDQVARTGPFDPSRVPDDSRTILGICNPNNSNSNNSTNSVVVGGVLVFGSETATYFDGGREVHTRSSLSANSNLNSGSGFLPASGGLNFAANSNLGGNSSSVGGGAGNFGLSQNAPGQQNQIGSGSGMFFGDSVCVCVVDSTRFLIADGNGNLTLITVRYGTRGQHSVQSIIQKNLGVVNPPSCLAYLDEGVVFVGSTLTNSQLVRLSPSSDDNILPSNGNEMIEILGTMENPGPIVDVCVSEVNFHRQVAMCCSAFQFGQIRYIRDGVSFHSYHKKTVQSRLKALMPLKSESPDSCTIAHIFDDKAVLERIFANGTSKEQIFANFRTNAKTLVVADVRHNQFVQVTDRCVILLSCSPTAKSCCVWSTPEAETRITVAAVNERHVLVCLGTNKLLLLDVHQFRLDTAATTTIECEVVSLSISPFQTGERAVIAAVATKSENSIRLLNLPQLTPICTELLPSMQPKCVVMCMFADEIRRVFVGTRDGHVCSFVLETSTSNHSTVVSSLKCRTKLLVGKGDITLTPQCCGNDIQEDIILAHSDGSPSVILFQKNRLVCSPIQVPIGSRVCAVYLPNRGMCMGTADGNVVEFGQLALEKFHTEHSVPIDNPQKIEHSSAMNLYVVAHSRRSTSDFGEEECIGFFDENTLQNLGSFALEPSEQATAICIYNTTAKRSEQQPAATNTPNSANSSNAASSANLNAQSGATNQQQFVVVVTGSVGEGDTDSGKGRLLLLRQKANSREPELVTQYKLKSCGYAVCQLQSKLVVTCGARVEVITVVEGNQTNDKLLVCDCSQQLGVALTSVASWKNGMIVVGDLLRGMTLLEYRSNEHSLRILAEERLRHMTTSVAFLSYDFYLASDADSNFRIVSNGGSEGSAEDVNKRLETCGLIHLGENCSLIKRDNALLWKKINPTVFEDEETFIFGSSDGYLGALVQLPVELAEFFAQLETHLKGKENRFFIGGFSVDQYRSLWNDRERTRSIGFLAHDFVELFLLLNAEDKLDISTALGMSVDDVATRVEVLGNLR